MIIGVLAVQGDFAEHQQALNEINIESKQVRTEQDLEGIDGLIIPGGESTTMEKLLSDSFVKRIKKLPIFGTCAGAILLAKWGCIDIDIERNAYGSQAQSFAAEVELRHPSRRPACHPEGSEACEDLLEGRLQAPQDDRLNVSFIRAPLIQKVGPEAEVLAEHDGHPVLVRQGPYLAATFHTEVTGCDAIHAYFCKMISA